ncbi:hypothetical protein ACFYY2_16855 [Streptomyces sp. NPDC001822]|uniref:hypothetical protein n=1 Tax=Streptomyces sp. NPDC001822 TaxID=3364614 RepID=UPI0036A6DD13
MWGYGALLISICLSAQAVESLFADADTELFFIVGLVGMLAGFVLIGASQLPGRRA